MNNTIPIHAFTAKYPGRVSRIITDLTVFPAFDPSLPPDKHPKGCSTKALWDTGATHSVITQETVNNLGLVPTGKINLNHAGGSGLSNSYLVNFFLPNKVGFAGIPVSECQSVNGNFGAIIGMDIICAGDFSITNVDSKTCMTFRVPSVELIDYVVDVKKRKFAGVVRNDPCPCGKKDSSGKPIKFKKCCGK